VVAIPDRKFPVAIHNRRENLGLIRLNSSTKGLMGILIPSNPSTPLQLNKTLGTNKREGTAVKREITI
jgi:hypothetical protein